MFNSATQNLRGFTAINLPNKKHTPFVHTKKRKGKKLHRSKRNTSSITGSPIPDLPHNPTPGLGILLALEPRIMFDGAAFVTGAEVFQEQAPQDFIFPDTIPPDNQESTADPLTGSIDLYSALSTVSTPSDRIEIVFIDTSVEDFQTLMEGIDPNAEVILLDSTRDGIEQIAEILGERTDIDAVHIISHGDSGELRLGTGVLNLGSMQGEYTDELATINKALTDEADFLIYGCNFGEGEGGQEAASLLAELTGADIAASDDLTGAEALGGDWDLEVSTGTIDTPLAINAQAQENWNSLLAPLAPTGEFLVHAASGTDQQTEGLVRGAERAVDIAPNGDYVVAWTDFTGNSAIFATVIDKDGNPAVAEFQINTSGGNNEWADVAIDDSGNFVVAWTQGNDILMRRFMADGTAIDGADVQVNVATANIQRNASINMNGAGNFVIAWEGDGIGGAEGIFVRQGSMAGGLIGSDIRVHASTTAQDPSVGIADSGNFVVAWDDGLGDVFFFQYNNAGTPQTGGQVDVAFQFSAGSASVDMAGDGRFAVAYKATGIGFGVYARQFDAAGAAVALPQIINTSIAGNQTHPSISMNDAGDFIVAWEGTGDQAGHIDANGVFAQKIAANGTKVGVEFRVNQTTTNSQDRASVVMLDHDNFVVVWTGSDGAQTDVFARQFGATATPTLDLDLNNSSGATGNNFSTTFSEGSVPISIADGDTNLMDADSTTFAYVTLSISGILDGNTETLILDSDTFALATAIVGQDTSGGRYRVILTPGSGTATLTITKQGGGTFSEAEVETLIPALQYQHIDTNNPTDGNRLIDITVNDGTTDSAAARSTINVNPVNDTPTAVTDGLTVTHGLTTILNLAGNDTDPDDGLNVASITIISGPSNGTIVSVNADGTVTYTHNGSATIADSFTYTIEDLSGVTSNTVTVNLTVAPNVPIVVLPPPPSPSPSPSPPADKGGTDKELSGGGLHLITQGRGLFSNRNHASTTLDAKKRDPLEKNTGKDLGLIQWLNGKKSLDGSSGSLWGILGNPMDISTFKKQMQSLLQKTSGFLKGLDEARDALSNTMATEKTYVASSIAVSSGLSIGYVIWLLRSGVLLTALLSSVPAWQFVNPLLVLPSASKKAGTKGEENKEDQALESIFDQQDSEPETSEPSPPVPSKMSRFRWFQRHTS